MSATGGGRLGGVIVFSLRGPVARTEIPNLCGWVRMLLEGSDATVVICDVGDLDPDPATLDALARMQLTASRLGHSIRLRGACERLRDLLTLVGLGDVFPLCDDLVVEVGGQPEQWEQRRGVEERVDPDYPTV